MTNDHNHEGTVCAACVRKGMMLAAKLAREQADHLMGKGDDDAASTARMIAMGIELRTDVTTFVERFNALMGEVDTWVGE